MSQSTPQGIPVRRVLLNHLSELPHGYGTTPGGTFFSTTPGGTRIIYDRSFLLKCRSSPMANTPPINLPDIPGVTSPDKSLRNICTKIVEEEEPSGKENGGRAYLINSASGYDPCMSLKSPLQQFRQRSSYQEKTADEAKCQEGDRIQRWMGNQYNEMRVSSRNLGDEEGHHTEPNSAVPLVSSGRAYPSSQLSLWRETKSHQSDPQSVTQPTKSASFADPHRKNELFAGQSELSTYRSKERGRAKAAWQENLCDSLENLYKTYSCNNFLPFPPHNNPAYMSYTPAYGQYNFGNQAGKSYDTNANLIQ